MSDITLDQLLDFVAGTALRTVYLPINENHPNFSPDWLKDLTIEKGEKDNELVYLKEEHPLIEKAYLLQGRLPLLDLDILFYADENNRPLTELKELVFTHLRKVQFNEIIPMRLNEMGPWDLEKIGSEFRMESREKMYDAYPIDPSLADIHTIGKQFDITMLGTTDKYGPTSNRMSASKKFEYTGGEAVLSYDFYIGKNGAINNFNIKFEMFNTTNTPADFKANINVNQRPDGGYSAKAEITVKSTTAARLGSYDGLVTYVFGEDGSFEEIRLHNGSRPLIFSRTDMENRQYALEMLQGIVVYEGQYFYKLGAKAESTSIYALLGQGENNLAISALEDGTLKVGDNCTLIPAAQLTALPGLQDDMLKVQYYRTLAKEFAHIGLFKDAVAKGADKTYLNYVSAIVAMANIQNVQSHDIPLLM